MYQQGIVAVLELVLGRNFWKRLGLTMDRANGPNLGFVLVDLFQVLRQIYARWLMGLGPT